MEELELLEDVCDFVVEVEEELQVEEDQVLVLVLEVSDVHGDGSTHLLLLVVVGSGCQVLVGDGFQVVVGCSEVLGAGESPPSSYHLYLFVHTQHEHQWLWYAPIDRQHTGTKVSKELEQAGAHVNSTIGATHTLSEEFSSRATKAGYDIPRP